MVSWNPEKQEGIKQILYPEDIPNSETRFSDTMQNILQMWQTLLTIRDK